MTQNNRLRIISKTMERMESKSHLPRELVMLLGKTAQLQAQHLNGINLDLSDLALDGSPLCPPGNLPVDPTHFRNLSSEILNLILDPALELPPAMARAAADFKSAAQNDALDLDGAFGEVLSGFGSHPDDPPQPGPVLTHWAERTPEAPSALAFLVMAAAAPSLEAASTAMAENAGLDKDSVQSRGNCPVCGSLPYMLELREKEGQRFAHCPCCRHTYRIRRLACACCNTDDSDKLRYFTTEGEPGYRVETCTNCNTYVKTIDFRALDRESFAPLNDLESLPLDILAGDEGFRRMAPSVWCI